MRPVQLPGLSFANEESRILQSLAIGDKGAASPPPGFERPIMKLTSSNGAVINIVAKEGDFTEQGIEDKDAWKAYLHGGDYLLVNPVDEKRNTDTGGISYWIGNGCGLQDWVNDPLSLGQVAFTDCDSGPYSKLYGQGRVANAATVIYKAPWNQPQPCPDRANSAQRDDCTADAVNQILRSIFEETSDPFFARHTWVIPALGTGNGKLPRYKFYEALVHNLGNSLEKQPTESVTLILLVWRKDDDWGQTKSQIAIYFGKLARDNSRRSPASDLVDRAFISGALLGIGCCLFAFLLRPKLAYALSSVPLDASEPIPIIIAWTAASIGLLAVAKQGIELAGIQAPLWSCLMAGFACVFLCSRLIRATGAFEASVRPDPR